MKKLNKQTRWAIAYAQNALSFLFLDAVVGSGIRRIFLYGSAVRGQLQKESDIDVFIDCVDGEKVEQSVRAAFGRFYQSKDYEKWRLLKFKFPLSVQAGVLDEWQLQSSIATEGILLYSKTAELQVGKRFDLFMLELPAEKKKYLRLIRTLFGRKEKGYKDKGLLGKLQGKRYGANVVLIPKEGENELTQFLQREKVVYSFKEISVMD